MREHSLKEPEYYMDRLAKLRERNKYANNWPLTLQRKRNRHRATTGEEWGWYEIWPLGIEVGYWEGNKSDLEGVDINDWNSRAKILSL